MKTAAFAFLTLTFMTCANSYGQEAATESTMAAANQAPEQSIRLVGGWSTSDFITAAITKRIVDTAADHAIKQTVKAYKGARNQRSRNQQANRQRRGSTYSRSAVTSSTTPAVVSPSVSAKVVDQQLKTFVESMAATKWEEAAGMVDARLLCRESLVGLLVDPADEPELSVELENDVRWKEGAAMNHSHHLSYLMGTIDHSSLRLTQTHRVSQDAVVGHIRYSESGVIGYATVHLKRSNTRDESKESWFVTNLILPSKHLTLLELVQYRTIETLAEFPSIAAMVAPGRLQQSGKVTQVLSMLTLSGKAFAEKFEALRADTKTWPVIQFRKASIGGNLASPSQISQWKQGGIRSESIQWLQASAASAEQSRR